jgi:hypothetical protein
MPVVNILDMINHRYIKSPLYKKYNIYVMYTEIFSLLMSYTSTAIFKTLPPLLLFSA